MGRNKVNKHRKDSDDSDHKGKKHNGVCNNEFVNMKEEGDHSSGATVCNIKTYKPNKNTFKLEVHGGWNGQRQIGYSDFTKSSYTFTYVKASAAKKIDNEHITRLFLKTSNDSTITKGNKTYHRACDANGRELYIVHDHDANKKYLRVLPYSKLTGEEHPLYVRTKKSGHVYSLRSLCGFDCGLGDGRIYFRVDDDSPNVIATITSSSWNYFSPHKLHLKLNSIATKDSESDLRSHPACD